MNGEFDIRLLSAGGFSDADFLAAQKKGCVLDMLSNLDVERRHHGTNQVFDNVGAHIFDRHMGGDAVTAPFNAIDGSAAAFWAIQFEDTSDEPGYTDLDWVHDGLPYSDKMGNYVSTTGIKRFVDDDIEATLIATDYDGVGKEEIRYRSRWLWLPNQGNSSNIKSLVVVYNSDGSQGVASNNYQHERAPSARIRIKDQNGNNTTINKTNSQVLFVEYTFYLVSV